MGIKKVKKTFWEQLFKYPSFNVRFWFTIIFVVCIFCFLIYLLFVKLQIAKNTADQIALINLIIQFATLTLGIFAAYYALRQLIETRFTGLDEAGMQELKHSHYSRAFEKWREAFYIRPDASVFTNMCETLLLLGDYDTFDQLIKTSYSMGFFNKEIFTESSDKIVLLYLKAVRHLLVKNQGEAEKNISNIILLAKDDGLFGFHWDFLDLQRSPVFQDLSGECRDIAVNLISYLSKNMQSNRKKDFELGNFASQLEEQSNVPAAE